MIPSTSVAWRTGATRSERPRAGERGMTLIELMVSMVAMLLVVGAALSFVISQVRINAATFGRSDVHRGGRIALSIMGREISRAGLGLPRYLAIREYKSSGDRCARLPQLSVASLDYTQQWTVSGVTGDTAGGTLTLESVDPTPTGVATDIDIPAGRWVYLYKGPLFDATTPTSGLHGHGMAHVGELRSVGGDVITVDSTTYGNKLLDLTQMFSAESSRPNAALLLAKVSTFGVDCTDDAARPYLYWSTLGVDRERLPLATTVVTEPLTADAPDIAAVASDVVGLRFRFLVDRDLDGTPDDLDGSGGLSDGDWVPNATVAASFPGDLDVVTAVEVQVRLRSEQRDPRTGQFQMQDFLSRIQTPNIHTNAAFKYIFVDNTGL